MDAETGKVTSEHLCRRAYVYVRPPTIKQVVDHTQSTERQYALRDRAQALGWESQHVEVIDCDLGLSGATADREGFRHLVSEVGLGNAGIVLGLEVSRLARNNTDWHRLLELCAMSDTLILDEEGLYDPAQFNDRLLLGLKGTLSESELHVIKARLQGGIRNKALRGELKMRLPVGFLHDPLDRPVLDPDEQVRQSVRMLFEAFERSGSATATVKEFEQGGLKFPKRLYGGPNAGGLEWQPLRHSRVCQLLHNPRYAGAFSWGKTRTRVRPGGKVHTVKLPREQWLVLLKDQHPGYISWEQFEANQARLAANTRYRDKQWGTGVPREGPALLQGLALCGLCGGPMTVRYHKRRGREVPDYYCPRGSVLKKGKGPVHQSIPGAGIDRAVGELLVESMTPAVLEAALQVQGELVRRAQEAERWRQLKVQRAEEEAAVLRRRYLFVDPANRLVAGALEAEWNAKLQAVGRARRELERQRKLDRLELGRQQRERVRRLATDFPALWNDECTPHRERKRAVRLLIQDVTLTKGERIALGVRLRGGALRELEIQPEPRACDRYRTRPALVKMVDELLGNHHDGPTAKILNERGLRRPKGGPFDARAVLRIRRTYKAEDLPPATGGPRHAHEEANGPAPGGSGRSGEPVAPRGAASRGEGQRKGRTAVRVARRSPAKRQQSKRGRLGKGGKARQGCAWFERGAV